MLVKLPLVELPMQVEVTVQNCCPEIVVNLTAETWEQWFRAWLLQLDPMDPDDGLPLSADRAYELSLRLTDDAEIQQLNRDFRQQDQPTDVLAFAALEGELPLPEDSDEPLYLGDIVISLKIAQEQAQEQGHSLETELGWLASHGLLHLLGWDHPDEASLQRMLGQQRQLLVSVGAVAAEGTDGMDQAKASPGLITGPDHRHHSGGDATGPV
jgi:probable rRNA maturation factor